MQLFANNAETYLMVDAGPAATSMQVASGAGMPTPTNGDYFLITLLKRTDGVESDFEICKCTNRTGNVLTVARGQEGTSAILHAAGSVASCRMTAASMHSGAITETTNKFFTEQRVLSTALPTLPTASGNIAQGDSILQALAKLQSHVGEIYLSSILDALTGQLTEAQLSSALIAKINLIVADDGVVGSVANLVSAETSARLSAIAAEAAARTSAIVAEATARGTQYTTERNERISADSSLQSLIETLSSATNSSVAAIQSYLATLTTADTALSQRIDTVVTTTNNNTAAITSESTARTTADTALGQRIDTVTASLGTASAAITSESSARVSADNALGLRIDSVDAAVGNNSAQITSEISARVSALSAMSTRIDTVTASAASNTAAVTSEITARANAVSALTTALNALTATVNDNTAAISNVSSTSASAVAAVASSVTTLQSTVGNNIAAINTEASTRATVDGYLGSQYAIRAYVSDNGRTLVGGMGISATSSDDAGPTIDFGIRANSFWIGAPAGSGLDDINPFYVQTTSVTVNGVTQLPGVYISNAYIANLSANKIDTRGLTIRDAAGNVILSAGSNLDFASRFGGNTTNLPANNATVGAIAGTNLKDASGTVLGDADVKNSVLVPSINSAAGVTLINSSGMTIVGNAVENTGGNGDWNASFRTKEGYVGGCYISWVTAQVGKYYMIALNSDPDTNNHWNSLDFAIYFDGGNCYVYESGSAIGPWGCAVGDVFSITYDGSNVRYFQNGTILRTVAAQIASALYGDSSFASIGAKATNIQFGPITSNNWSAVGGSGKPQDNATVGAQAGTNLKDAAGNIITDTQIKNNLIDLSGWVEGSVPWSANGEYNVIAGGYAGPKGTNDLVWFCKELNHDGQQGGGWNAPSFTLDTTKTYRFAIPIQRRSGSGQAYWGTGNVASLNTSTPYVSGGGPYFASTGSLELGKWYLFVGYIFPAGSSGNTHDGAGIYDCTTGAQFATGTNFTFLSGQPVNHRAYQYYASNDAEQLFGRPMINVVDGTEPALREFFAPSAVLNSSFVGLYINSSGTQFKNPVTGQVFLNLANSIPPWLVGAQNASVSGAVDLVKPVDTSDNTQAIKTLRGSGSVSVAPTNDGNSVAITGLGSEIDSVVSTVDITLTNTMTVPPGFSFQAGDLSSAYELEMDFYITDVAGDTQFQIDIDAPSGRSVISWVEVTQSPRVIGGDLIWPDYWFTEWSSTIYYQQYTGAYPLRMRIKAYISPGTSSGGTINVSLGHDSGYNPKLRPGSSIKYSKFSRKSAGAPASLEAARWGLPTLFTLYSENDNYRNNGAAYFDLYFYSDGTWQVSKYLGGSTGPDLSSGTFLSPATAGKGEDFEIVISLSGAGGTNAAAWSRLSETRSFSIGVQSGFSNPSVYASTTATISIRKVGDPSSVQSCTLPVSVTSIYTG